MSTASRLGGFTTLVEALQFAARGTGGIALYSAQGTREAGLSYGELDAAARRAALQLSTAGLRPGSRLALVATTDMDFLTLFYGCQYASIVACPVPFRTFAAGRAAYVEQIGRMLRTSGVAAIAAPAAMLGLLEGVEVRRLATEEIFAQPTRGDLVPFEAGDPAYVQYSSGSTSDPKGVLVTQRMVAANATGILSHGLRLQPDDRAFSWLPLYHDMGLVGFSIAPMFGQCSVDYISPSTFARRPALWLELMAKLGSTICYSPSFGYRLAAQRYRQGEQLIDLSRLRVCGVGGDMVRAEVLEEFSAQLAPTGFRAEAFLPSYGMAESTLAISFADPGRRFEALASDTGRRFVACGPALPGHELVVEGPDGVRLPEGEIGRIWIRGPSVMTHYADDPSVSPLREDGFLATGDLGYVASGAIVVTGRHKDLILHNGRNVWPQDIEWAVERIAPLRPGDVAAFAVEDAEADRAVVLVQTGLRDEAARDALRTRVSGVVAETAGMSCEVQLVPPHSLPFTSSGKLARARAREIFSRGGFI